MNTANKHRQRELCRKQINELFDESMAAFDRYEELYQKSIDNDDFILPAYKAMQVAKNMKSFTLKRVEVLYDFMTKIDNEIAIEDLNRSQNNISNPQRRRKIRY